MRPLQIVSFLDGRLGHEKQTKGVLRALGRLTPINVIPRKVKPSIKAALKNRVLYLFSAVMTAKKGNGDVDLIIGTGIHTHIPMLIFKKECGARVVTCMTPDFLLRPAMDLCLVPQHDRQKSAANIFFTVGPPNNVVINNCHDMQRGLILVGGVDHKSHHWRTETVINQIQNILAKTRSIKWVISSSPRTPRETLLQLEKLASDSPEVVFFKTEETGEGWIEAQYTRNEWVWVTADSVSMIFEALTAGCRVGILPVQWKHRKNKFKRSLDYLLANDCITLYQSWLDGTDEIKKGPQLDEASRCAREILRRWWPDRLQ